MSATFGQKSESSNMKSGGSSGQELSKITSPTTCFKKLSDYNLTSYSAKFWSEAVQENFVDMI